MGRTGSAVAVLCLVTLSRVALGQPAPTTAIAEAAAAFSNARFERARTLSREVIASPSANRPELARAHALLVALELMFGQEAEAQASAEAAIALDPTVAPPEGSPEAVAPLFAVMRERRQSRPIRLTVGFARTTGTADTVRAHAALEDAPAALVGSVEVRCRVGGGAETTASSEGVRVDLVVQATGAQEGSRLGCRATARTPGGAPLLETRAEMMLGSDPGDSVSATIGGAPSRPSRGGGISLRTWTWVGLGAVTVVTAVGVILVVAATTSSDDVAIGPPEVQGF